MTTTTNNANTTNGKRDVPAITATIDHSEDGTATPIRLTLTFSNGNDLTITDDVLQQSIRMHALYHGLKQKLVDAAAISRNPETGRAATVEDKYEAVKAVYDRLLAGQWNATREGGGATGGLLLQALVRMYAGKKTPDDIRAYLETKSDAEKAALRKNPKVAALIDTIRAETGKAANIDTDALLGELED